MFIHFTLVIRWIGWLTRKLAWTPRDCGVIASIPGPSILTLPINFMMDYKFMMGSTYLEIYKESISVLNGLSYIISQWPCKPGVSSFLDEVLNQDQFSVRHMLL